MNPPRTGVERGEIAPPLGLLYLAAVAREAGAAVVVEDYNLLYHLLPDLQRSFYEVAVRRLLALDGDVYGFTSMAVDSHVGLELARRVKEVRPAARTVFGGPHFTTVGQEFRERFPWVDAVVGGEGERPFAALLHGLIPGSPSTAPVTDRLLSAEMYSAVELPAYFHVNPNHLVNVDAGRGCRYKCAFCYSPGFYGGVRDRDIDELVSHLGTLHDLGVRSAFLVGDNLLNNALWASRFCAALAAAGLGISWHCYATIPDLTEELVTQMGRAGCTQVFMGLDVVGPTSEKAFRKAFLRRRQDVDRKLRALRHAGVRPTCGFILCPPSHSAYADRDATLAAAVEARLAGADVLFNALTLYPGTRAHQTASRGWEMDPTQAQLLMDVPRVVEDNPLAVSAPHLFPFHARYTSREEWGGFLAFCHAAHTIVNSFAPAMAAAWREDGVPPSAMVERILDRVGDLMATPPGERRLAEQAAALEVFRDGAQQVTEQADVSARHDPAGEEKGVALPNSAKTLRDSGQGFW